MKNLNIYCLIDLNIQMNDLINYLQEDRNHLDWQYIAKT